MAVNEEQFSTSAVAEFVPTVQYAQTRLPGPPPLAVPPPVLSYSDDARQLDIHLLEQAMSHDYGSSEYGNPAFLDFLRSSCKLAFSDGMTNWVYNMRRTAQPILPFLFLGPDTTARDAAFVGDMRITMLIAVRSAISVRAMPRYMTPSSFPSATGLNTLTVDLDTPYDLITQLPQAIKAMNEHLEESCANGTFGEFGAVKGKILVFCESGNERSTALVAAYLMTLFGLGVVPALQIIQSQRFCITPDEGMKSMLLNFQDILTAKREVAMQTRKIAENTNKKSKRNLDMLYDDDDEMSNDDAGSEDAGARRDWAPFQAL